jgi:hypothetical protein
MSQMFEAKYLSWDKDDKLNSPDLQAANIDA